MLWIPMGIGIACLWSAIAGATYALIEWADSTVKNSQDTKALAFSLSIIWPITLVFVILWMAALPGRQLVLWVIKRFDPDEIDQA